MTEDINKNNIMFLLQGLEMGGLEKMVVDLVNNMPPSYRISMCCYDSLGPLLKSISSSIEVIYLKRKSGFDLSYIMKLFKVMRKKKIEIVHLHNRTAFIYGTIAARLAGIRNIIYTEHGRTIKLTRKAKIAHRLMNRVLKKTVVVTRYLKEMLVEKEGFNPNKIIIIPNGIDGSKFMINKSTLREENDLSLKEEDKIIGIVARLDPIKNHKCLIGAMTLIEKEEPKAKLLVVGDGPLKSTLIKKVKDRNLQETIYFLGEREDIPNILAGVDLFVLSSLSEGMSITLVEAMAAGLPIIATEVGGNPDLIDHGKNGILVPKGDENAMASAILKVLKNTKIARSLGAEARKKYESEYTLDMMVKKYIAIYENN